MKSESLELGIGTDQKSTQQLSTKETSEIGLWVCRLHSKHWPGMLETRLLSPSKLVMMVLQLYKFLIM